jgi:hypothetical protein
VTTEPPHPPPAPTVSSLNPRALLINSSFFSANFGESPKIYANQGYATDGTNNYLFSTQKIVQADSQWNTVYSNAAPFTGITLKVDHIGDGEVSGGKIYAPLACATQEGPPQGAMGPE